MELASWEGDVDAGERGAVYDFTEGDLFFLQSCGDRGACGVEKLADGRLVFFGNILDASGGEGEGTFFAEDDHACVI